MMKVEQIVQPARRRLWLVALLALALGACAASEADLASGVGLNGGGAGCEQDDSCGPTPPTGLESVSLALRVIPPDGSRLSERHITGLTAHGDLNLEPIALAPTSVVTGRVFFQGADVEESVRSSLTFRRDEGISVAPLVRTVASGIGDEVGAFSVELAPGSYQVTVRVEDNAVPLFSVADLEVTEGTLVFDIALPDPETYFNVTGSVVRQGEEDRTIPLRGASIILVSPETGVVMSTTGETVDGVFSVQVPPAEAAYGVRISPGDDGEPVPDLTLETVLIEGDTDLGELVAGGWADAVDVTNWRVEGVNGEAQAIDGAAVFFLQELEHGRFSRITFANEEGRFSSSLIPGDYTVTLIPPEDLIWAAGSFSLTVNESTQEQAFPLPHKPTLQGFVLAPTGMPVDGVTVIAESVDPDLAELGAATVTTSANGLFLFAIHPGAQRVTFVPQQVSALSPVIYESFVGAVATDLSLDVMLPAATQATGHVVVDGGAAVAGATVEAYVEVSGELVLLSTVETDATGRFAVNLPVIVGE